MSPYLGYFSEGSVSVQMKFFKVAGFNSKERESHFKNN